MRASIDLTKGGASKESDSSGSSQLEPATKCPCLSSSVTAKLDGIAKGVLNIQKVTKNTSFPHYLQLRVVSTPKCCGRIVGCQGCGVSQAGFWAMLLASISSNHSTHANCILFL